MTSHGSQEKTLSSYIINEDTENDNYYITVHYRKAETAIMQCEYINKII